MKADTEEKKLLDTLGQLRARREQYEDFLARYEAEHRAVAERIKAAQQAKTQAVDRAIVEPSIENDAAVDKAHDALAAAYAAEARLHAKQEQATRAIADLDNQIQAIEQNLKRQRRQRLRPAADDELQNTLDRLIPALADLSVIVAAEMGDTTMAGRLDLGKILHRYVDRAALREAVEQSKARFRDRHNLGGAVA